MPCYRKIKYMDCLYNQSAQDLQPHLTRMSNDLYLKHVSCLVYLDAGGYLSSCLNRNTLWSSTVLYFKEIHSPSFQPHKAFKGATQFLTKIIAFIWANTTLSISPRILPFLIWYNWRRDCFWASLRRKYISVVNLHRAPLC